MSPGKQERWGSGGQAAGRQFLGDMVRALPRGDAGIRSRLRRNSAAKACNLSASPSMRRQSPAIRRRHRAQLSGADRRLWRDGTVADLGQPGHGAAVHGRRRPRWGDRAHAARSAENAINCGESSATALNRSTAGIRIASHASTCEHAHGNRGRAPLEGDPSAAVTELPTRTLRRVPANAAFRSLDNSALSAVKLARSLRSRVRMRVRERVSRAGSLHGRRARTRRALVKG